MREDLEGARYARKEERHLQSAIYIQGSRKSDSLVLCSDQSHKELRFQERKKQDYIPLACITGVWAPWQIVWLQHWLQRPQITQTAMRLYISVFVSHRYYSCGLFMCVRAWDWKVANLCMPQQNFHYRLWLGSRPAVLGTVPSPEA